MTTVGTTTTSTCAFCGDEFEIPLFDSRGRRRAAGQIAQSKYCPEKDCAKQVGMIQTSDARRAKAGRPLGVDARKTRGLADHTIEQINAVRDFVSPAQPMSVRSCCYHLLSLGLLKSTKDFPNMQSKITHARLRNEDEENYLDDDCFVDRSRVIHHYEGYSDLNSFVTSVRNWYSRDPWQDQPVVPIILCEKIGHGEFLRSLCDAAHVRLCLSKGTHARSFLCGVAEHCATVINNGQVVSIGYIGDHDCSGLQMEVAAQFGNDKTGTARREGLRQILRRKYQITDGLIWERLALTEWQFRALPDEARVEVKDEWTDGDGEVHKGDNNAKAYIARFGPYGGEVEALGIEGMKSLVSDFIAANTVETRWKKALRLEKAEVKKLAGLQL
jgi:hypothetical protein